MFICHRYSVVLANIMIDWYNVDGSGGGGSDKHVFFCVGGELMFTYLLIKSIDCWSIWFIQFKQKKKENNQNNQPDIYSGQWW